MGDTPRAGDDQRTLWNGPAAHGWVAMQDLLDRMLQPFEELLLAAVAEDGDVQVLDVGCGTGAVALAVARRLGARGRSVGVDVSEPMLAAARARAAREETAVDFVLADAQTHGFPAGRFDRIVSRFGVMFFDDPVQAFANLRHAAADGAGLRFVAWRSAEENPFMTAAERTAAPLLPDLPVRRPDGPGQFAFADRHRIRTVLEAGGWADVEIRPVDVACTLPEQDLPRYLSHLGPVGRALRDADPDTHARVLTALRTAFEPWVRDAEVCFRTACWLVDARATSAESVAKAVSDA